MINETNFRTYAKEKLAELSKSGTIDGFFWREIVGYYEKTLQDISRHASAALKVVEQLQKVNKP